MDTKQLFGKETKFDLNALSSEQKKILFNLTLLWSMRSDLEIGKLLDNITCLDPGDPENNFIDKEDLHDVTNAEFDERLLIQIEAFSQMRKGG